MDFNELDNDQIREIATQATDKDLLRSIATHLEITFSGNTGVATLKEKILEALPETSVEDEIPLDPDLNLNDPVAKALAAQNQAKSNEAKDEDVHVAQTKEKYSTAEMLEMDPAQVRDDLLRKKVVRAQALRLRRVRITNLDPADAAVPGAIISVVSKYTGKIAKFIPFDEEVYENGYHVPQMILDDLASRTYNVRKEVKKRGATFGVKEYKTVRQKKFVIEYLSDLTPTQLKSLAQEQTARGAIDRSN